MKTLFFLLSSLSTISIIQTYQQLDDLSVEIFEIDFVVTNSNDITISEQSV
jgi:hypothetical protein